MRLAEARIAYGCLRAVLLLTAAASPMRHAEARTACSRLGAVLLLTAAASSVRLAEARALVRLGAPRVLTPPAPTMRYAVSCSSSLLGAAPLLAFALLAHGAQQLAAGVAKPQRGLIIGVTIHLSQQSWHCGRGVHTPPLYPLSAGVLLDSRSTLTYRRGLVVNALQRCTAGICSMLLMI